MSKSEILYVGVQGNVVAYEKSTGRQLWSTNLTGSSFVNLLLDGDRLFAHSKGELFALDAQTGRVLWQDGLKGYGYGLASLVTESSPGTAQAILAEHTLEEQRRSDSTTAVST